MKIRGSLARRAIKQLHQEGKIKLEIQVRTVPLGPYHQFMDTWWKIIETIQHHAQMVYTRAIAVDDAAEEAEAAAEAAAAKAGKKGKKK